MSNVKRPCIGCIYFEACGSATRTQPCDGRQCEVDRRAKEYRNGK